MERERGEKKRKNESILRTVTSNIYPRRGKFSCFISKGRLQRYCFNHIKFSYKGHECLSFERKTSGNIHLRRSLFTQCSVADLCIHQLTATDINYILDREKVFHTMKIKTRAREFHVESPTCLVSRPTTQVSPV